MTAHVATALHAATQEGSRAGDQNAQVEAMLHALGDPTRYAIVQLLLDRHHCARSLAMTLGISESAVSQHMGVLKECGLVTSFRHGYHLHYVLSDEAVRAMVGQLQGWLDRMATIQDCHDLNPCRFKIGDTTTGCLYRSARKERERA